MHKVKTYITSVCDTHVMRLYWTGPREVVLKGLVVGGGEGTRRRSKKEERGS